MRFAYISAVVLCCTGCNFVSNTQKDTNPIDIRFAEVEEKLEDIVASEGVLEAAAYLDSTVKQEPALEDLCHGLSHLMGEAAYRRYGYEGALRYESDVCGSGYIHGVVESYLVTVDDIGKEIATLCAKDAPKCFHGIGHGLMDRSNNDLPGSLALCESLREQKNRIQCAEGVFMENVEADPVSHPTKYLRPDDPFFPCRGQSTINKGVCALYAPRYFLKLHPREYEDALAWCETLGEKPRDACAKGVGEVSIKQNITKPLLVQDICDAAAPKRRRYCIEGLVSYYIVHFAAASKGRELCEELRDENKASCEKTVRESEPYYPR